MRIIIKSGVNMNFEENYGEFKKNRVNTSSSSCSEYLSSFVKINIQNHRTMGIYHIPVQFFLYSPQNITFLNFTIQRISFVLIFFVNSVRKRFLVCNRKFQERYNNLLKRELIFLYSIPEELCLRQNSVYNNLNPTSGDGHVFHHRQVHLNHS